MLDLKKIIMNIFQQVDIDQLEIYNEFSLQHELEIVPRLLIN
jgi:hypothetical protein